jgi:hypothetical protein
MSEQAAISAPIGIPDRGDSFLNGIEPALSEPLTREVWKYTSLPKMFQALLEDVGTSPEDGSPISKLSQTCQHQSFADLDAEAAAYVRETFSSVNQVRYPIFDLGAHLTPSGLFVDVQGNTGKTDASIEIDWSNAPRTPVLIRVAPGVRLTILETAASEAGGTRFLNLDIGANAEVIHARTDLSPGGSAWQLNRVIQAADSRYNLFNHARGGQMRRFETQIQLNGEGASSEMTGGWWLREREHLDQQMTVEHTAAHTTSHQKFHAIGEGRSRSIFNGRIHIHKDISDVDAHLVNRNLVQSDQAEMNTKPELEIYSDDVRCSHGATVGQMSADSVFYLLSRGIDKVTALTLLRTAFLREIIDGPRAELIESNLTAPGE